MTKQKGYTVMPDEVLEENEWYKYISSELQAMYNQKREESKCPPYGEMRQRMFLTIKRDNNNA